MSWGANGVRARALILVEQVLRAGRTQASRPVTKEMTMRVPTILAADAFALAAIPATAQQIDWGKVDAAFGRKAAVNGEVHRYGFPRSDLSVTLDGVAIKPGFALGGWVALKAAHGGAMVMGD